jgi:transcriptional regulator with XRE-family HTH domain
LTPETFGQRVRRLRLARKFSDGAHEWSQSWVAEQLGLQDRVTVWLWEHDRNVPTNKHMQQLAELLGVSEMYLRFGEPAAPPDERQLCFAQAGKP